MPRIVIIVGNPKPQSRTRVAAEQLVSSLVGSHAVEVRTIDLAEYATDLFDWEASHVAELNEAAATADLLVVASPTYKASYTGLLKAFLDRYGHRGLAHVVAVPLMTGATLGHALSPDFTLRPLLVELGASVPTGSLYVDMSSYDRLDEQVSAWVEHHHAALAQSVRFELQAGALV